MKDGDNYVVALPVTSLLPAQPADAAFNKATRRINLFNFFPSAIKDWSLIPSTIRAERYSNFCNYLIYTTVILKFFVIYFFFLFLFLFISFRCESVKEYA